VGVGLDSSEKGHPPSKFKRVFEKALNEGFLTVAHAGEEGPPAYIHEAIDFLKVSRIDHGNNAINDAELISKIVNLNLPLTMCPLSNLKLRVHSDLSLHPLKKLMDHDVLVTVNSDDPAYFDGYINENYIAIANALKLKDSTIKQLAINSFKAAFMDSGLKKSWIEKINCIN